MGFFTSDAIKSASFDPRGTPPYRVGTVWAGEIKEIREPQQQNKFRTEAEKLRGVPETPDFWPDGSPKMHLPMVIQAEQLADQIGQERPDGSIEDGLRVIYWDSRKRKALRERLKELGIRTDPEVGDWVALKWVSGVGETGDPKIYAADFRKGQPKPAGGGFFTEGNGNGGGQPARQPARVPAAPVTDEPPF